MATEKERLATILAFMYGHKAEVVINISNEECYLYLGTNRNQLELNYQEVNCLINNGIIEFDSGCDEKGHETEVYVLTEKAQERIKAIIKDKKDKTLLLKE